MINILVYNYLGWLIVVTDLFHVTLYGEKQVFTEQIFYSKTMFHFRTFNFFFLFNIYHKF